MEPPSQIPKRASGVQTGSTETSKSHFSPGQIASNIPTPGRAKKSHLQLQQELDNKRQYVRYLEENLETLKIKREEDKQKLKKYDEIKIQLEHMVEFKHKILEYHSGLQRELQKAKLDAKNAVQARQTHADEMVDLAHTVESVTLDKEIAEEKAAALHLDLDACKERLKKVILDYETLENELQERRNTPGAEKSTHEIKQLKSENERLRETLVKMRHVLAHEKHVYQKLLKDIDKKKSEISQLGRNKEKLCSRVEQMEEQIADLNEHVDLALGAEEMVVLLGQQKLLLEEKLEKLEEERAELEALQDVNEELVENNAEIEADLREQVDMARGATRDAIGERDAALETIADREITISKFREIVQKLQEHSQELQQCLEEKSSKLVSSLPEIIDFEKMFTETKTHTNTIDFELRRIDLMELHQRVKYLTSFIPDSFMNRGGDFDAVLILLLIPRLIKKLDILVGHVSNKFPRVEAIDRASIIKSHSLEQFAFRCRLSYHIYGLQAILHQYLHILNICKPEILLTVGAAYHNIATQEKIIDGFVELVKCNQLDENVKSEAIEKCINYFNTVYPILLGTDNPQNHCILLSDNVKSLGCACDGINNDALIILNLIGSGNIGKIGLLVQYVITTNEQIRQQLKQIKRRIPPDSNLHNLGFTKEVGENLYQCYQHVGKIMRTLHDIVKNAVSIIVKSGDVDENLPEDKMNDLATNASLWVYEQDDLGPVQSIKNSFKFILTQITQLLKYLQDHEYVIVTNEKEDKPTPPIEIRAQLVKKELEENTTLATELKNKKSTIKELRQGLKEKQDQLSEITIRKNMVDKKISKVSQDYELKVEKLERQLEEVDNDLKRKQMNFEKTVDHLQNDINSLKSETEDVKEEEELSSVPNELEVEQDSPLLLQELNSLRRLYNMERDHRIDLQNEKVLKQLNSMPPLLPFEEKQDKTLDSLVKEGTALKQDILMKLATPKFPPIYLAQPGQGSMAWQKHFAEEEDKMLNLKGRADKFQTKVTDEVVKRKFGGKIETNFTVFPTNELTEALKETKPVNIGCIKIPQKYLPKNEKSKVVNMDLEFENLQNILANLKANLSGETP